LARQYAQAHKDNLVIAGVRDPKAESVKALRGLPNLHVVHLDVTDEASIRQSVVEVERLTKHVDVLINNAGVYGEADGADPVKATAAQFTSVFTVNVTGVLLTTQAYLPLLRRSTAGAKVINVSSGLGSNQFANAFGKPTLSYGTSKAALNYLTTAFRYAVPEVTFLSIHPGWVATDMGKGAGGAPPTQTPDSAQAIRYYVQKANTSNSGDYLDTMTGNTLPY
jgi:NAD(P)-dependent dehydrogenase (short-subunit alcohol dehydrogenase family)